MIPNLMHSLGRVCWWEADISPEKEAIYRRIATVDAKTPL
jgi:hypothetical protein